ncbi:MAG TPA: hypothetical protein VEH06_07395 [Candidatus Bathyarchaeia archaeon]|nr:hypothetical protein [Candidatus Bathyarchaeia archaeon]
MRRSINGLLHDRSDKHHLAYSIEYAFNQFGHFGALSRLSNVVYLEAVLSHIRK